MYFCFYVGPNYTKDPLKTYLSNDDEKSLPVEQIFTIDANRGRYFTVDPFQQSIGMVVKKIYLIVLRFISAGVKAE